MADARGVTRGALLYAAGAAVVAMFSYATGKHLPGLVEIYWAPIAAVMVLYPDRDATLKAGLQRFLGSAIGCFVGGVCAAVWHGRIVGYGAGVMLAVGACELIRCQVAARLAAVAVTVITIVPHSEPPHLVAIHRFVEVSYGVGCALAYTSAIDFLTKRLRRRPSPTPSGG